MDEREGGPKPQVINIEDLKEPQPIAQLLAGWQIRLKYPVYLPLRVFPSGQAPEQELPEEEPEEEEHPEPIGWTFGSRTKTGAYLYLSIDTKYNKVELLEFQNPSEQAPLPEHLLSLVACREIELDHTEGKISFIGLVLPSVEHNLPVKAVYSIMDNGAFHALEAAGAYTQFTYELDDQEKPNPNLP